MFFGLFGGFCGEKVVFFLFIRGFAGSVSGVYGI